MTTQFTTEAARWASRSQRAVTTLHTLVYRLSGGRIGGRLFDCPVLLLSTIGRRTHLVRTVPLLYLRDNNRIVLVASNGGAQGHPTWYLNGQHYGAALIEIGRQHVAMRARSATSEEHQELWPRLTAMFPRYAAYQQRTRRRIPLLILEPITSDKIDLIRCKAAETARAAPTVLACASLKSIGDNAEHRAPYNVRHDHQRGAPCWVARCRS